MNSFTEAYFPPPGHTAGLEGEHDAPLNWFPLALLLEHLGTCGAGRCTAPTAYIATAPAASGETTRAGSVTALCYPACDEHVCELAEMADGHRQCPKCHVRWALPDLKIGGGDERDPNRRPQ